VATLGILYITGLSYLCYERTIAWQNTENMLGDVINQYPEKVPQAYKYLGIYYAKSNRIQDAFNCYNTLVNKMHVKDGDVYCNLGQVERTMGNMTDAVKYFQASLQIDSNLFMSYQNLGVIYADSGKYEEALRYYMHADRISPHDEGLYMNIASLYTASNQFDKAISAYNFLIGIDPDNPLHYFNKGVAEYSSGDKTNALKDFERAYTMPPTPETNQYHLNATAAQNLSVIYKEKGEIPKADYYESEAKRLGGK
jgi:tetratricopeptide (TPR) repeat protein